MTDSHERSTRVGFIGLGSQGAAMARRITDEGYPLSIWARRPATLEPFVETDATVASSPAELGAASDIVGVCVVADTDVEEVVLRSDGVLAGMAPGAVIAIHSTVHPDTCVKVATAAAAREVAVVDAPVSGGGGAAAARKLLVMAGGATDDVERCRPVFETFGDPVLHLGPLGSGEMAKLLNNLVFTAQVGMAVDAFEFAARLGVDRAALAQVLASGSGVSQAAAIVALMNFDTTGIASHGSLLAKDVRIMRDVASSRNAAEPESIVGLAQRTLARMEAQATDPG
jgi:3-hydroxyisobutyrate dehydrogenase-like beta-hydroxyacid dehydrogenase